MSSIAFILSRDKSNNSFSLLQQDLMFFVIRMSEYILVCTFIDALTISIIEPHSHQVSMLVVEEMYLPDDTGNRLTCQLLLRLNLKFTRLKLWVKFTIIRSVPHCNDLIII